MRGVIQRLRAEVRSDYAAFDRRVSELEPIDLGAGASPAADAQAAVALHHAYGAIESMLVRLIRFFDGELPAGADWHQELLHAAELDLPETRPRLLSASSVAGLRQLLAFRHFFRHAYTVDLDSERLAEQRRHAIDLRESLSRDIEEIDGLLEHLADEAARDPSREH